MLAQIAASMKEADADGPAFPVYKGPFPAPTGSAMTMRKSGGRSPSAPTDLTRFRNKTLPAGGLTSAVDEPSTDQSGKHVFATGNWYAAYSHNNAKAWTYLDPFTIFGSGYCCDQVTVYDATHDRQFWLLQYGDHLVVANSSPGDLANWCWYNWYASDFGLTGAFDYNHMAVSTSFLYVTSDTSGGALVWRMPIDAMSTCGGFSYNYVTRASEFADAFAQGGGDTMYWGSDWTDLALGNHFRVLSWADNSGSYSWYDRTIDAFSFMFFGGAQNCASSNGVVLNWCQRTDSRMSGGGYVALASLSEGSPSDSIIGFAFNANQDGGHTYPYIRRIYFRLSDVSYIGYSELWGTDSAILYPDMAADSRGHVGIVWAFGGGSSNTYPGSGFSLDDDVAPIQPWSYLYSQYGSGNPCLNTDNLRRWGDYLTVHPMSPARDVWVGTAFALTGNAGSCSSTAPVQVKNFVFGRERDRQSYVRWKNA